jgi:nicotinamide-nucleotide amidase
VIKEFSVVSEAVASAMASRTQIMNTDYAIATTGNAGPTKGDAEIGLFLLATPNEVIVENIILANPVIK